MKERARKRKSSVRKSHIGAIPLLVTFQFQNQVHTLLHNKQTRFHLQQLPLSLPRRNRHRRSHLPDRADNSYRNRSIY